MRRTAEGIAPELLEALESRRLMSASLSPFGVLTVLGTSGNDVIRVTRDLSGPVINVQVYETNVLTFSSPLSVSSISVSTFDGLDNVVIDSGLPRASIYGGTGDDWLHGGDADDYIDGWTGHDVIRGGGGNDRLLGYTGNDWLYGQNGNDTMWGEDNDDVLDGGIGTDLFWGGTGTDTADYSTRTADLMISPDNVNNDGEFYWPTGSFPDPVGPASSERDDVRSDVENVRGGSGNDTIFTAWWVGSVNNKFWGDRGNDTLSGDDGNDTLDGGMGDDHLHGNDGDDSLVGFSGNDWLHGGDDNDTLEGGADNDNLSGDDGNDSLLGSSGNDTLLGWDGVDTLRGGTGDDWLEARDSAADIVDGGIGNDRARVDNVDMLTSIESFLP
jgi:Ca2+-binding RTX toxin-like protein